MSEFDYESHLDPELSAGRATIDAAAEAWTEQVRQLRATCDHPIVVEVPYQPCAYLLGLRAQRMCLRCRLEEEAETPRCGTRQWSAEGKQKPDLGNTPTRVVLPLDDRDRFYTLRLGYLPRDM